jgi:hypothetical protein
MATEKRNTGQATNGGRYRSSPGISTTPEGKVSEAASDTPIAREKALSSEISLQVTFGGNVCTHHKTWACMGRDNRDLEDPSTWMPYIDRWIILAAGHMIPTRRFLRQLMTPERFDLQSTTISRYLHKWMSIFLIREPLPLHFHLRTLLEHPFQ